MKLSVITVAYNNLDGLMRTAQSVQAQTYHDYEWIVVDGNSQDGTRQYLEKLEPQPDYWCSEPDKGIYDAMNKALTYARGEWCIFMNSGDSFFDADVLQQVFASFPEGDIIYGDALYISANKQFDMSYPEQLPLTFWVERCICHQATFIRRQLLVESGGYSTDYRIVSDWRAWVMWTMQGRRFVHLPIKVCRFMLDGIGSTKLEESRLERERVFEEMLPDYVKPLLFDAPHLDQYVVKLHQQFLKKPLIRASIALSRNNWFVRKFMESMISIGCLFERCFYSPRHSIRYSDGKYDARHPETFIL